MSAGQIELRLEVPADPERCWKTLTDVSTLVEWVGIVEDAEEHEPLRLYSATLMDRVGPFSLRADIAIRLTEVEAGRVIHAVAEGEDRQVASRILVDATLRLVPLPDGTRLEIDGTYEVTGRVATMGASMIKRKASDILAEFTNHATRALE